MTCWPDLCEGRWPGQSRGRHHGPGPGSPEFRCDHYRESARDRDYSENGAVAGVKTALGDIKAETVVNCAGMWARQLGAADGITIPNQAAEHYYLITEELDNIPKNMPVLEDPSHYGYYREEVGGLMIGLFEPVCAPWKIGRVPEDFIFGEIEPDWDRMGPFLEKAMSRVPVTLELGVKNFSAARRALPRISRPSSVRPRR